MICYCMVVALDRHEQMNNSTTVKGSLQHDDRAPNMLS